MSKPSFEKLVKFKENPHVDHLYSLEEVADYCNRTTQLLRVYYSQGLLPEPKHSIRHKKKTTRKFNLSEARQIKNFFNGISHGSIAKARTFKRRQEAANAKSTSQ